MANTTNYHYKLSCYKYCRDTQDMVWSWNPK